MLRTPPNPLKEGELTALPQRGGIYARYNLLKNVVGIKLV